LFPLRDKIPSRSFPFVTIAIIIFNVLVYFYQLSLGQQIGDFIKNFGIIPKSFSSILDGPISGWVMLIPNLFTSMFIHGGLLHLLGNLWYLWIFGDNVEDFFGHFPFFLFYLASGLAGAITHIYFNLDSTLLSFLSLSILLSQKYRHYFSWDSGYFSNFFMLLFQPRVVLHPAV